MFTSQQLTQTLECEVDDLTIAVAQHDVQGFDLPAMVAVFACDEEELREVMTRPVYKDVRKLIAFEKAKLSGQADISWDSLEYKALQQLHQHIQIETDPEFHLKVAAMANKAERRSRRTPNDVIAPAHGNTRVQLRLTERIVEKLQNGTEHMQERRIDIRNADAHRANAKEVGGFLKKLDLRARVSEDLEGFSDLFTDADMVAA